MSQSLRKSLHRSTSRTLRFCKSPELVVGRVSFCAKCEEWEQFATPQKSGVTPLTVISSTMSNSDVYNWSVCQPRLFVLDVVPDWPPRSSTWLATTAAIIALPSSTMATWDGVSSSCNVSTRAAIAYICAVVFIRLAQHTVAEQNGR